MKVYNDCFINSALIYLPMSRTLCPSCHRPKIACICAFTTDIANDTHLVVLQHPSEECHTKGTVTLLAKSLRKCQVLVGEIVDTMPSFLSVMAQYQPVLLYPGEQAHVLDINLLAQLTNHRSSAEKNQYIIADNTKPICLVILDATWKKAYRMFMLSTTLQHLPQVCLPEHLANAGQYHIRKVAKKNALSSLEASCYALALLEQGNEDLPVSPKHAGKYQPLLEKFQQFNQFQLSFRPEHKTPEET
ncbi:MULTISPECIES: tRNA-uridine aminocarboxypropyltransferase [Colwellia]|uniref:tRNA-uridine aminocarboxypropyltransferase n=1 Tax=Colwellia marinimaniae TaxID=1513592 RepID=A0ABQ0MRZ3_9GAMM|nr:MULTISPECIES: tRNA-uridine aminocarboxypropyltransferase [Colwellia]GAW95146.1 DTW domain-containing protein [Colwellia marinimaniae]